MSTLEEFEIYKAVTSDQQNILNDMLPFSSNCIYDIAIRLLEERVEGSQLTGDKEIECAMHRRQ